MHVIWYLLATQFQYAHSLEECEWNVYIKYIYTHFINMQSNDIYKVVQSAYTQRTHNVDSVCTCGKRKIKYQMMNICIKKTRWPSTECSRKIFHMKFGRRKNVHNSLFLIFCDRMCVHLWNISQEIIYHFDKIVQRLDNKNTWHIWLNFVQMMNWWTIQQQQQIKPSKIYYEKLSKCAYTHIVQMSEKLRNFNFQIKNLLLTDYLLLMASYFAMVATFNWTFKTRKWVCFSLCGLVDG